ncbi:MAG: mechanosensitive ion channel [Deltaproteobacteria bacterium]|nr:mechanosensitive ion channel [Deltaproteobacteria bacterium]
MRTHFSTRSLAYIFLVILHVFFLSTFSQPAGAADGVPPEQNTQTAETPSPQSEIEEKLKKTQETLAGSDPEKIDTLASQANIPVEQFEKKIGLLREIEATYQRQLALLAKQSSLQQEEKILNEQIDSHKGSLVVQLPPYSLTTYDLYLDQLEKTEQQDQTLSVTLEADQKKLEEARSELEASSQSLRQITEEVSPNGEAVDSPAQNMQLSIARLEQELAEANLGLLRITADNNRISAAIAGRQKNLAQQQLDRVRANLTYDEKDLQEKLKQLDGLRQKIKGLLATLEGEQQKVEEAWHKAQEEFKGTDIDDAASRERSKSWLDARQAWSDTYQQVLEQQENTLRLISQAEETWRRRYALLKQEAASDDLDRWEKESGDTLQSMDSLIKMAQNTQNSLQPQIVSLKMRLAQEHLDPAVAQNLRTMQDAQTRLLERTLEYLTRLQTRSRFETRFLAEIRARQENINLLATLKGAGASLLNILDYEVWVIDDQSVTVKKVLVALMILIIGLRLAKFISRFTTNRILLRTKLDESDRAIFDRILYFLMLVLIVLFALDTVNIPLTALTFLGGAFAIGVGFGTQNLLNNLISGFILMLERPVKIGDTIEIDNTVGAIEEIGIRCIRIRTPGNVHILVPNSSLLEKNIVNWTLSDQIIRCQVRVGVAYGADVHEVGKLLRRAVDDHGKILKKPEPIIIFNDFGDNALIFDAYYWIQLGADRMGKIVIESDVRFLIEKYLREGGIAIPFPQRDIHLATTRPLEVKILGDKEGGTETRDAGTASGKVVS